MKSIATRCVMFFVFSLASVYPISTFAGAFDCGQVKIVSLLSGPRHGSMMKVSNPSCGSASGWICLDPAAETMSAEVSKRLYAEALSFHMADKAFYLSVYTDKFPAVCGGVFPAVEDFRTSN